MQSVGNDLKINIALHFCFSTVVFLSIFLNWQFSYSLRIMIYDVFIGLTLLLYIFVLMTDNAKLKLDPRLKPYVFFGVAWLGIILFSGFNIFLGTMLPEGVIQYFKGLTHSFVYTFFFVVAVYIFSSISPDSRARIIKLFVIAGLISVLYQLIQVTFIKMFGINLDNIMWSHLSVNLNSDKKYIDAYAWGYFYRGTGLVGTPNVQGFLIVLLLPYFMAEIGNRRNVARNGVLLLIMIVGLLLTMSRAAIGGAVVSFIVFMVMSRRSNNINVIVIFVGIALLLVGISFYYSEDIAYFIGTRNSVVLSDRGYVGRYIFERVSDNVLGYGHNVFSADIYNYAGLFKYSSHNSWLLYLYEEGIQGLLFKIYFLLYLMIASIKAKNDWSSILMPSLCATAFISLFHTTMDLFFGQLYIMMIFSQMRLESKDNYEAIDGTIKMRAIYNVK